MIFPLVFALALQAASPVQTVAKDAISMVEESGQVVARTPAELAGLWKKHIGDQPPPKVDFGSRMVVAVFLGSRSSSGFSVEITGTRESAGVMTVEWRERRPDPADIAAQILTSPYHIATVPRFAGDVRFQKVDK